MHHSHYWAAALLLLSAIPASQCAFTFIKAEGQDICAGIIDGCKNQEECSTAAYGPCAAASPGPSAYVTFTPQQLAWVYDIDTYNTDATKRYLIDPMTNISVNGFLKYSASVPVNDATYAYMMAGSIVGSDKTRAGYVGVMNAILTKGTIKTKAVPVYFNTPDDPPSDHNTFKREMDLCITSTSNGACNGEDVSFSSCDIAFMTYDGTMGSNYQADPNGKFLGIRIKMKVVDSAQTTADLTFNSQSKKLSEIKNVEVDDMSFTLGGKLISLSLSKAFNYLVYLKFLITTGYISTKCHVFVG